VNLIDFPESVSTISTNIEPLRSVVGVDQDIRILGVKNWKKVALNRDKGAKLLKKARTHQGLSSQ
jgi:hypothetical protein